MLTWHFLGLKAAALIDDLMVNYWDPYVTSSMRKGHMYDLLCYEFWHNVTPLSILHLTAAELNFHATFRQLLFVVPPVLCTFGLLQRHHCGEWVGSVSHRGYSVPLWPAHRRASRSVVQRPRRQADNRRLEALKGHQVCQPFQYTQGAAGAHGWHKL